MINEAKSNPKNKLEKFAYESMFRYAFIILFLTLLSAIFGFMFWRQPELLFVTIELGTLYKILLGSWVGFVIMFVSWSLVYTYQFRRN